MNPKKNNSGGKKFQSRMPDEKRVKVSPKKEGKPEPRFRFDDKPYKKKPDTREGNFDRDQKPDRKPYGEKRTGSFNPRKSAGDEGPYKKRTPGGKPEFGERKTYGDKPFTDRPKRTFRTKPERGEESFGEKKPYGKKPFGAKKPFASKPSFGEDKTRGKFNKPVADKKYFKDEKGNGKNSRSNADFGGKPNNFKGRNKSYNRTSEDLLKGKKLVEDEVRLNRYIANSGLCSRREADVMIEQGLVTMNGETVLVLGTKVNPGDDVRVDGKRINPEKPVYILLNKPKGYITSTSDPDERSTVMDLIDLPGKERIYPVGRLDRNTTGVLLLTNDGDLAQKLMHPSFEIKKIYRAKLNEKASKDHLLAWVNGVELEDGYMAFEQVGFVDEEDNTVLGLEVHSGRNRIVRRMFEHFGYEVMALDRVMLGEFDHVKLGRGKWRFLNEKEVRYVEQLKRMKGKKPRK